MMLSPQKRQEIIDALRRGTVPGSSLDTLAVGLGHLTATVDAELRKVRAGGGVFNTVRGEYGCVSRSSICLLGTPIGRCGQSVPGNRSQQAGQSVPGWTQPGRRVVLRKRRC